jgi:hypothetical protein
VSVALVIQHARRKRRYYNLWSVRVYRDFPHYLIKGTAFGKLQAREFKWGLSVNKWSDVKCRDGGDLTWFMWSDVVMKQSEVKWSDVKWVGEVFVYVH